MAKILLLNGPNLNLLGTREPNHYGTNSLNNIAKSLATKAIKAGHNLTHLQSNAEHTLLDEIQAAPGKKVSLIIINPGAFTHTSIALRDAIIAVNIPFIEVHLSNIASREVFRQKSYFSDIAIGVVSGFGSLSYHMAMYAALEELRRTEI
ncbi:MAG: type II 3-dehydroquinate dehydratase [Cellvibrionales bacterium TMED49]|nr:type II 3-dehydroquinate dehydratase [Porticoccaceae bacterium]OUU38662.1 MAG: type II 3-dehydroquinate dehydratase [Cellvibrionales bacterium TMED49]